VFASGSAAFTRKKREKGGGTNRILEIVPNIPIEGWFRDGPEDTLRMCMFLGSPKLHMCILVFRELSGFKVVRMELKATLPFRLKRAIYTMPYANCITVTENRTAKDDLLRSLRAYTLSVPSVSPSPLHARESADDTYLIARNNWLNNVTNTR
jgi:hypothetical protein